MCSQDPGLIKPKTPQTFSNILYLICTKELTPGKVYVHDIARFVDGLARPLLPYLYAGDNHFAGVLPCWEPRVASIPEVFLRGQRLVNPRFTRSSVFKPTIGATNSNVENEIELLVKGSSFVARLAPRINQAGAVRVREGEISTGP